MLRKCIKIIAAGLLAFLVLSIFSGFYYNLPIHKKSDTYATDYVWEPNRFQARGTEGFSYGWTDAKGFNNKEVVDDISVLMMGSSHMEALNVQTEESATSLLNDLFSENKVDMRAYNIGISGHPLARCINNLENAVKEFAPSDYVVIETATPKFTKQEMQEVLDGTYKRDDAENSNPVVSTLQKIPYIRLLYKQVSTYMDNEKKESADNKPKKEMTAEEKEEYAKNVNLLLKKASDAVEGKCKLIFFLNETIKVDENNEVIDKEDTFERKVFKEACENNNILLIDMHDDFAAYYKKYAVFPHGFSNTAVGEGHLNKYGHMVIAARLYDTITKGVAQ